MADNIINVALVAPPPALQSGDNGVIVRAPAPLLLAQLGYHSVAVSSPAPVLVATINQGIVVSASLRAPVPQFVATGVAGGISTAVLRAPAPQLAAVLLNPIPITAALRAPATLLSSTILSGNLISVALMVPVPIIVVTGFPDYVHGMALRAPAPRLNAAIISAVASTYDTWVLNTRKGVLTEYGPEFAFNSFANFNGVVLACGAGGVVVLGIQDDDNGVKIDGKFRTGQEAFASSLHKRIPRLYVSGNFAGDMLFRTITEEGGTRTYSLPYNNNPTSLQQRRVPIGKGPRSRYWQFEIENTNGADFGVNDLLVYPTILRRRVM